jgi:hypothetical protein
VYEREADLVAEQVLTKTMYPSSGRRPAHVQHVAEQPTSQMEASPASVERMLATPGRPLEPTLRREMEQALQARFLARTGAFGAEAEASARDVNADWSFR